MNALTRLRASQAAGAAVVAISALVLGGLVAGEPWFATWGAAGLPAMTPLGAALFAVSGYLLMCTPHRNVSLALGFGIVTVAAADLGLRAIGAGDEWRVAVPATSMSLVGLGTAFAFAGHGRHLAAAAIAAVVAAFAAFALVGFLTGVSTLYNVTTIRSPPLPVAVSLLTIAAGMLLRASATPALQEPRPLWHLLAALGGAVAVPLLLFGAYAGARMADAQLSEVREELMDEARGVSGDVDREVIGEIETLHALAGSPSLQRGDFEAFQRQAEAPLALRRNGSILLTDRNLRQIVNTSAPYGTPLPHATVIAAAIERAFATGQPQVTSLFVGPVSHEVMFSIVIPVTIDGDTRYALARSPTQSTLERVVTANGLSPGGSALLFDDAHRVIASSNTAVAPVGDELPPSRWQRGAPSGLLDFTDDRGQLSLQAWTVSEVTGWGAAVVAPYAVLRAPLRPLWRMLGVMALFSASLVAGLAVGVGRFIAGSVGHAARAAVAAREGRPLPNDGTTPIAEVNTLMEELRATVGRHAAAEGFLRDSERRLQLALGAAGLGSWQHDPARGVVSGDGRARQLFGLAEAEVPCERVLALVDPRDRGRLAAALAASLAPEGLERAGIEFRLWQNGEVRWVEVVWLVGRGGTPRPAGTVLGTVVGTVADVTARKEIEEERRVRAEKEHLLMREMNHRAKNMLSVVDAIAHQTATSSPDDFVKRFSSRIQSLSANQDLLFRSEWKGVEITALVHAQLAHFADLIPARIGVEGPTQRLTPSSAQAIGLALHELATNAGKYGALSKAGGRVDIRWDVADVFTMTWVESGGPLVSPPTRQGFGSVVMGRMVERGVGGSVDLVYAETGVTWRLTCPRANALEDAPAAHGVPEAAGVAMS